MIILFLCLLNIIIYSNSIILNDTNIYNEEINIINNHKNLIRTKLLCQDINTIINCNELTNNGDTIICNKKKKKLLLLCPNTCNWCDISNKFCEDIYLTICNFIYNKILLIYNLSFNFFIRSYTSIRR